jgi:hypothetical protein
MPMFNSIEAALKYIEANLPINLNKMAEEIKSILRNNVRVLWYERDFTPTHYTRTMELIDCISVKKAVKIGNAYQVKIYFDTNLINPYPSENGEWSKHESITDGRDVSQYIPSFIEYGQNSPLFPYDGVHPVQETIDWIKEVNYLKTRMMELLKDKGFSCI